MELAPSLNMCRRIVDLVSTGVTLKSNGLKEIEEIMKVQSKLIINRSAFKTNNKKIQSIIDEIKLLVK
jgi:ATP phosphoribosyltransferase